MFGREMVLGGMKPATNGDVVVTLVDINPNSHCVVSFTVTKDAAKGFVSTQPAEGEELNNQSFSLSIEAK